MANNNYSTIIDGAIGVSGNKISFVGKKSDLPKSYTEKYWIIHDMEKSWILPGLVDCHTHLVYGGSRSKEFEMKLAGVSYEEIARKGGGIFSTVKETRKESIDKLYEQALKRVNCLFSQGATTIEIKSGYGLDLDCELKMLEVIKKLDDNHPCTIKATFLGAHALPHEFRGKSDQYIDFVVDQVLPEVKKQGIATSVDAFCENIGFSLKETEKVLKKAKDLGFDIKLHAEQLTDSSSASMAAELGALSCDHLEYVSKRSLEKMAQNNVIAVLLPGAFYYLKEKQKPPIGLLREFEIPMAVSTDLNPGSSPVLSLPFATNMACVLFGLTPREALLGVTVNGAKALGLEKQKGTIEVGKDADFVAWDIAEPCDLSYYTGISNAKITVIHGDVSFN
ncbi:MAG: imidazolonepropionase [Desulfobacteraceae bacterium]|nr:imidazolonepropionase [Desulfobacteraceae bacterium]